MNYLQWYTNQTFITLRTYIIHLYMNFVKLANGIQTFFESRFSLVMSQGLWPGFEYLDVLKKKYRKMLTKYKPSGKESTVCKEKRKRLPTFYHACYCCFLQLFVLSFTFVTFYSLFNVHDCLILILLHILYAWLLPCFTCMTCLLFLLHVYD